MLGCFGNKFTQLTAINCSKYVHLDIEVWTNSSELRTIYLFKSHKPFQNRLFGTNTECFISLFVKIKPKTQVLKPKTQRVHWAAILNFGRSTRCFVLSITQVNHVISNFRMMSSCIVSMQVATCAAIVV